MPKILIVGTAPYDKNCQSRAFESYFHGISSDDLAQIFSYPHKPPRGHCGRLFQITDSMMLKRFFHKKYTVGQEYLMDELEENGKTSAKQNTEAGKRGMNRLIAALYQYGKKDRPTTYLLRGLLWKKSHWCTEQLNKWLDDFKPDVVFLSFSDDFFIPSIAYYVAEKFDIPIISSIADDYIFNDRFSLSPFYYLYRGLYKRLIGKILHRKASSAIYIGDKIKEKYNEYYHINGETLYLTTDVARRPFQTMDPGKLKVGYFGNIRLGRDKSLAQIGEALYRIDPSYRLDVYSNEKDGKIIRKLAGTPGVNYCGSIPYDEVVRQIAECDILVIVESFERKNVKTVKYSISTKVPDSLGSGAAVFAYGDIDCGAIEYIKSTGGAAVCDNTADLDKLLRKLIHDADYQKSLYDLSEAAVSKNHNVENNARILVKLAEDTIERYSLC